MVKEIINNVYYVSHRRRRGGYIPWPHAFNLFYVLLFKLITIYTYIYILNYIPHIKTQIGIYSCCYGYVMLIY